MPPSTNVERSRRAQQRRWVPHWRGRPTPASVPHHRIAAPIDPMQEQHPFPRNGRSNPTSPVAQDSPRAAEAGCARRGDGANPAGAGRHS